MRRRRFLPVGSWGRWDKYGHTHLWTPVAISSLKCHSVAGNLCSYWRSGRQGRRLLVIKRKIPASNKSRTVFSQRARRGKPVRLLDCKKSINIKYLRASVLTLKQGHGVWVGMHSCLPRVGLTAKNEGIHRSTRRIDVCLRLLLKLLSLLSLLLKLLLLKRDRLGGWIQSDLRVQWFTVRRIVQGLRLHKVPSLPDNDDNT